MKSVPENIKSLIVKSLGDNLTEQEEISLLEWLDDSEENIIYYAKIKDLQTLLAVQKIREDYIKKEKSRKLKNKTLAFVSSIAAVFVLGVFLTYFYGNSIEKVVAQNTDKNSITIFSNGIKYLIPDSIQNRSVKITTLTEAKTVGPKEEKTNTTKITVPSGKTFKTILEDGTEVYLNANSTLVLPSSFDKNKRVVTLVGEAYFSVTKDSREFIVKTKNSSIKVLGTKFNVQSYTSDMTESISLVEGSVDVCKLNGENGVRLGLGKRVDIDLRNGDFKLSDFNVDEVLAWKNGLFMFDDKPLGYVLSEVERWYVVKFEFTFESLKNSTIYLKMKKDRPLSEILEAISATNHVKFNTIGDRIYVLPKIQYK